MHSFPASIFNLRQFCMTVYNIVGASEEEAEMRKLTTLNYILCTRKPLVKLLLLIILVFLITELVIFSKAPEKSTTELLHNEPNWLTEEITPKTPVEVPIIPQGRTDLSLCDIGFLISATDSNHTGYLKKSWLKRLCGNHMDPYREKPYPAFPRLSRQSKKNAKGEDNWMIYDDLLTMEDDECASFSSSVCCNLNKHIKGLYEKWPKNKWYMIVGKINNSCFKLEDTLIIFLRFRFRNDCYTEKRSKSFKYP